jgi:hypothetical protein
VQVLTILWCCMVTASLLIVPRLYWILFPPRPDFYTSSTKRSANSQGVSVNTAPTGQSTNRKTTTTAAIFDKSLTAANRPAANSQSTGVAPRKPTGGNQTVEMQARDASKSNAIARPAGASVARISAASGGYEPKVARKPATSPLALDVLPPEEPSDEIVTQPIRASDAGSSSSPRESTAARVTATPLKLLPFSSKSSSSSNLNSPSSQAAPPPPPPTYTFDGDSSEEEEDDVDALALANVHLQQVHHTFQPPKQHVQQTPIPLAQPHRAPTSPSAAHAPQPTPAAAPVKRPSVISPSRPESAVPAPVQRSTRPGALPSQRGSLPPPPPPQDDPSDEDHGATFDSSDSDEDYGPPPAHPPPAFVRAAQPAHPAQQMRQSMHHQPPQQARPVHKVAMQPPPPAAPPSDDDDDDDDDD